MDLINECPINSIDNKVNETPFKRLIELFGKIDNSFIQEDSVTHQKFISKDNPYHKEINELFHKLFVNEDSVNFKNAYIFNHQSSMYKFTVIHSNPKTHMITIKRIYDNVYMITFGITLER